MTDNNTELLAVAKLIRSAIDKCQDVPYDLEIAIRLMEAMPCYEHMTILKTIFQGVADVAEQDNQGEHMHQ